jgi:hypothetical protein
MGGLTQTRDDTIGGLQQQRGAGLQEYGYTEDPNTHAIAFDPNNPYSQAALLRKHYQQAKTGNTTSYAAQGQLYAGSLQNAQNASTDQFNASDDALTNAVINFLANNTTSSTTAAQPVQHERRHRARPVGAERAQQPALQPLLGCGYGRGDGVHRRERQHGDHGRSGWLSVGAAAGQQHGEARQRLLDRLRARRQGPVLPRPKGNKMTGKVG